jgi:hypothetical protein
MDHDSRSHRRGVLPARSRSASYALSFLVGLGLLCAAPSSSADAYWPCFLVRAYIASHTLKELKAQAKQHKVKRSDIAYYRRACAPLPKPRED